MNTVLGTASGSFSALLGKPHMYSCARWVTEHDYVIAGVPLSLLSLAVLGEVSKA